MIKCITFDLDDTLWKIEPVITRAEVEFQKWLEKNYPMVAEQFSIEKLRNLSKQTSLENSKIKHDLSKVRILAYEHIRSLFGLPANMPVDAFNYFMKYRNTVLLFDGVKEILEILSNDYLLGTITNGNASLETIGIKNYFDFEVKASEVGHMKPRKEIFEAVMGIAKCKPSEIIHVGDSYEKDIIGAISVNMNYIWINHNNEPEKKANKKYIIKNFNEITEVLEKFK
jgi:putative hydrolase of the HAD superfamily